MTIRRCCPISSSDSRSTLHGVRILDFTQVLSGPLATMLLADAGADVVKVERPPGGDLTRQWGPPFVEEESVYFAAFNRGKRSICLDLTRAEDQVIARRLAGVCDVVIENLRPGALERLGLGYRDVLADNPRVIYLSIRGYRPESPRASDPALEVILEAESGMMSITGSGNGEYVRQGVAVIDMMTGMAAVGKIMEALYRRAVSGEGGHQVVSLEETAGLMMTHPYVMYLVGGAAYPPSGTTHPSIAPYEHFRTGDRAIILGAVNDGEFYRLAKALGHEEWSDHPVWSTNAGRVRDREAVHEAIEAVLRTESADHWVEVFRAAKLVVGIIETVPQAAAAWAETGPFLHASHPRLGVLKFPPSPWRREGSVAPPPILDGDRRAILRDWLGDG